MYDYLQCAKQHTFVVEVTYFPFHIITCLRCLVQVKTPECEENKKEPNHVSIYYFIKFAWILAMFVRIYLGPLIFL
jgi:hypothetical protein